MTTPSTRAERAARLAAAGSIDSEPAVVVQTLEPAEYTPDIPAKVRTVAYFAVGISAPAVGLATAVTAIWAPDAGAAVAATGVAVLSFLGTVAGVFGIAYRPTR